MYTVVSYGYGRFVVLCVNVVVNGLRAEGGYMSRGRYDKELVRWARRHHWDSLEPEKDLILRHLRTFAGDGDASQAQATADNSPMDAMQRRRDVEKVIDCVCKHGGLVDGADAIDTLRSLFPDLYVAAHHQ